MLFHCFNKLSSASVIINLTNTFQREVIHIVLIIAIRRPNLQKRFAVAIDHVHIINGHYWITPGEKLFPEMINTVRGSLI